MQLSQYSWPNRVVSQWRQRAGRSGQHVIPGRSHPLHPSQGALPRHLRVAIPDKWASPWCPLLPACCCYWLPLQGGFDSHPPPCPPAPALSSGRWPSGVTSLPRELPPSCKCENTMARLLCARGCGRGGGRGNGESVNAFGVCTSVQSMPSTYETCRVGAVRVETSE